MSLVEHYRERLQRLPKAPADRRATALAAVDAFEACERKRQVTATDLIPLVVAASSPHTFVCGTGCNLLIHLATEHKAAQQSLLQMAQAKNATVRFNAVWHFRIGSGPKLPNAVRLEIVELALSDRSTKVRRLGIEGAEQFKFSHLLPQLEEMQRTETNQDVQQALAFHIPLLRDGFLLKPSEDGRGYLLAVRGPEGSVGGPFIPKKMYSEEYVRNEVARLQAGKPRD
jgi:hypothetical protein